MEQKCGGFWRMCLCDDCRRRDRELSATLDKMTPKQRLELVGNLMEELVKRGNGPEMGGSGQPV